MNRFEFPDDVVCNGIAEIRFDECDTHKSVHRLRAENKNVKLECLKVSLNSDTCVAESITWTYPRTIQLAGRCRDVILNYFIHNLPKCLYDGTTEWAQAVHTGGREVGR